MPRAGDLVAVAVLGGMLGWGLVGLHGSLTENTYPWNVWVPLDEGITKGAAIGLLAGVVAAWAARRGTRVLVLATFVAAVLPGTVRALLGAPQPALYFLEPMPDSQWYGTTMLMYWSLRTLAPALGVTAAVALLARVALPGERLARLTSGALIAASLALVWIAYLPVTAPPQGNGQHVNEGPVAILGLLTAATLCFWTGVVRLLLVRRRSRRPESVLVVEPTR